MLDRLLDQLKDLGKSANAQAQREAMIDLLIWMMYADNLLALPENERIDRIAEESAWNSPTPARQYLNASIARIRDVISDPSIADEMLDDIYRRLGTSRMRLQAYEACRDLAQADGQVAEKEVSLLNRVRDRFDLAGDV